MRHKNGLQIGFRQKGREGVFWRIPIVMVVTVFMRMARTCLQQMEGTNQNNSFILDVRIDYPERGGGGWDVDCPKDHPNLWGWGVNASSVLWTEN